MSSAYICKEKLKIDGFSKQQTGFLVEKIGQMATFAGIMYFTLLLINTLTN